MPVDAGEPDRVRGLLQRPHGPRPRRTAVGDRLLRVAYSPASRSPPPGTAPIGRSSCPPRVTRPPRRRRAGQSRWRSRRRRSAPNLESIKALCLNLGIRNLPDRRVGHRDIAAVPHAALGQGVSHRLLGRSVAHPGVPLTVPADPHRRGRSRPQLGDVQRAARHPADQSRGHAQRRRRGPVPVHLPDTAGTATAALTDQNGDKPVNAPAKFTVSGCPGSRAGAHRLDQLGRDRRQHQPQRRPVHGVGQGSSDTELSRSSAARHAPKIRALTVALPPGLRFRSHRHGTLAGVTLTAARIKTLSISHGRLTIVLRKAASTLTVEIHGSLLSEAPRTVDPGKARPQPAPDSDHRQHPWAAHGHSR